MYLIADKCKYSETRIEEYFNLEEEKIEVVQEIPEEEEEEEVEGELDVAKEEVEQEIPDQEEEVEDEAGQEEVEEEVPKEEEEEHEEEEKVSEEIECPLCWESFKISDTYSLSCQHRVCKECYIDHVKVYSQTRGIATIKCPGDEKCGLRLTGDNIEELVPEASKKYMKFFIYHIIDKFDEFFWCTGKDCEKII